MDPTHLVRATCVEQIRSVVVVLQTNMRHDSDVSDLGYGC